MFISHCRPSLLNMYNARPDKVEKLDSTLVGQVDSVFGSSRTLWWGW